MMYVVCSSGYMEERVRLNKLKEVLLSNNYEFTFIGWLRGKKYKRDIKSYKYEHIWIGGGYANKLLILHYPMWIIKVFFKALQFKKKDLVWAVGLDVAIPIYIASKIKKFDYVFDNPDNFSLTYNLKGNKKKIVDWIENKVAKNAKYHIIPSETRFPKKFGNELFIPNFPLESEYIKANKIYQGKIKASFDVESIKSDKRFKIYINGRMTASRGYDWVSDVLKELDEKKFLIIVVGDINCSKLKDVIKEKNNFIVYDRLPNYEALSIYMMSDIVLAFYDPKIPINVKAEPNKWWDCVKCQVPFVSNIEIETLKTFKNKNACFTVNYRDKEELVKLLNDLEKNKEKLEKIRNNLKEIDVQDWQVIIEKYLPLKNNRKDKNEAVNSKL